MARVDGWGRLKRMRILYVAQNIPVPGTRGGSTHVTEVTRALRKDHDVMVLAQRGSTGAQVVGLGVGDPPGFLRHAIAPLLFPAAYRHARRFRPDLIYERYSSFGLGVLLGRALRVPVVSMILDEKAVGLTLAGAQALVTTEKDMMNLPAAVAPPLTIHCLRIGMEIENEAELLRHLLVTKE